MADTLQQGPPPVAPPTNDPPLPPPTSAPPPPPPPSQPLKQPTPASVIHYGTRHVKARIDAEVPLQEIIRQLAASTQLQVAEPAALFALREKDTGTLVTEDNLERMLERGNVFDLCSSPTIEAVEMVDKLHSSEPSVVKLATFSLRTLIKERAFLNQFIARGGLEALQDVIRRSTGNTLAYSLLSLQNLLELDEGGWTGLERSFVARIVEIIATEPLINISRPATAILRRLASQSPSPPSHPTHDINSPSPDRTPALSSSDDPSASGLASGFAAVYDEIQRQPAFLAIVIERLSSGDVPVTNSSLALLNTLLRGSTELGDLRLAEELDALDAWKVVGKLLAGTTGADLPTLLSLQTALVASLHLTLLTRVDTVHYNHFDEIWLASGLEDTDESNRWRRLGFRTESPQFEFDATGLLGLKMLARYATDSQNEFAATIQDQLSRPSARRCPISTVSTTCLYLLAAHFSLLTPPTPSVVPNPYLFRLPELHALTVAFFLRIFHDSGASSSLADFERVARLTESQVAFVLGGGGEKKWFTVRQEFLSAEYRAVRERQMREMEIEDDLTSKAPVRNLRGRLYLESYEFLRAQRIACLHEGAWFLASSPSASSSTSASSRKAAPAAGGGQRWRFYRLAANRKALHWVEAAERREVRSGLEELPERLDLALVTDITTTGASSLARPKPGTNGTTSRNGTGPSRDNARLSVWSRNSTDTATPHSSAQNSSSSASPAPTNLSFTLHSADGPLVTLSCPPSSSSSSSRFSPVPPAALFSEWVDGLSLLRPASSSGGSISTQPTAEYAQALTDVGVKVKLLDLGGERVEVPKEVVVGGVPGHSRFFYADSL
ncbi:hypothetical protein JCM8097_007140 [Rhodosporidiobolus ruineniae]